MSCARHSLLPSKASSKEMSFSATAGPEGAWQSPRHDVTGAVRQETAGGEWKRAEHCLRIPWLLWDQGLPTSGNRRTCAPERSLLRVVHPQIQGTCFSLYQFHSDLTLLFSGNFSLVYAAVKKKHQVQNVFVRQGQRLTLCRHVLMCLIYYGVQLHWNQRENVAK